MSERTYLGDGLYASFDGFQLELRTGDGNNQVVYVDPDVFASLCRFALKCWPNCVPEDLLARRASNQSSGTK